MSFTRAADALGISVSAASMQIQTLEEYLGLPLLRRHGRLVELTAEGAALLPKVRDGLNALQGAIDEARAVRGDGPLRVSTLASFLLQWLLPRLQDFEAQHPDIDLRLETSTALVDFRQSDMHVAIRFGEGHWPGLWSDKLLDEWLVPVCQPALLAKLGPVEGQEDLKRYRLLHSLTEPWSTWLLGTPVAAMEPSGAGIDDSAAIVRAAEAGGGLALARWSLASDEVQRGRLAVASRNVTPYSRAYYFVCPPKYRSLPKVNALHAWLRKQASLHPAPPSNR
jgi:LysR family glycine cleavage system transcriptional activator